MTLVSTKMALAKTIEGHRRAKRLYGNEPSGDLTTSDCTTLVTTLTISTRRTSTKWRSGTYHLTGRTKKAYHVQAVGGGLNKVEKSRTQWDTLY